MGVIVSWNTEGPANAEENAAAVPGSVPDAERYRTEMPSAASPGTYYVWYRVAGDSNHEDTEPQCLVGKIRKMKGEYICAEGAGGIWVKESGDPLSFCFRKPLCDKDTYPFFTGIEVDGKPVSGENYRKERGSVWIHLMPAWLEGLSSGEHRLEVMFEDGTVQTTFEISEADVQPADLPPTGDAQHPLRYLVLVLTGQAGISVI